MQQKRDGMRTSLKSKERFAFSSYTETACEAEGDREIDDNRNIKKHVYDIHICIIAIHFDVKRFRYF